MRVTAFNALAPEECRKNGEDRFIQKLCHPLAALADLETRPNSPWKFWIQCTAVAVLGSLLFGVSLVRLFPEWNPAGTALWFAFSAGMAWLIFGVLLSWSTGIAWRLLLHACLVTTAIGEAVLIPGAIFQLACADWLGSGWAACSAWFWVIASNLAMFAVFAAQMLLLNLRLRHALLLWFMGLNGTGALLFYFYKGLTGVAL